MTHSIDYKDYESYYSSNDYSVKILINQLLDEGHCAGNEEVCGASHYRYDTNENWIKKLSKILRSILRWIWRKIIV